MRWEIISPPKAAAGKRVGAGVKSPQGNSGLGALLRSHPRAVVVKFFPTFLCLLLRTPHSLKYSLIKKNLPAPAPRRETTRNSSTCLLKGSEGRSRSPSHPAHHPSDWPGALAAFPSTGEERGAGGSAREAFRGHHSPSSCCMEKGEAVSRNGLSQLESSARLGDTALLPTGCCRCSRMLPGFLTPFSGAGGTPGCQIPISSTAPCPFELSW